MILQNTITAKRIFKGMPDHTRKAIINQVINVQGLKSPMSKLGKQAAIECYGSRNEGERNFLPLLFQTSVRQHL